MNKLKLDLDALQVDTFDVDGGPRAGRGTVRGAEYGTLEPLHRDTGDTGGGGSGGSGYFSCTTQYPTNENTCQGSCYGTCIYTCNAPPGVLCA